MSKPSFSTWFTDCLRVERYPMPGEIARMKPSSHVLNVSDEYIYSCASVALAQGIYYHWQPLNECTGHMGINSLFGALVLLHEAEQLNQAVLLHCHAGVNRSQMVRDAYYFLRTGRHLAPTHKRNTAGILVNFTPDNGLEEVNEPNMLQWNCQTGMLPPLVLVEKFLKHLGTKLEETSIMAGSRGGLLTQLKLDIGLQ